MEVRILDQEFKALSMVDIFNSFIWTDRYDRYGDFEIYTTAGESLLQKFANGSYLYFPESQHLMIIEGRQIICDVEEGNTLTVTGRSLESLLDRRIIWNPTQLTGNLQLAVKKLLDENVIVPGNSARAIPNFIFDSSTDPVITALTIEAQFLGENLYDVISTICSVNNLGFQITLDNSNNLRFKLYSGTDRSYAQSAIPYVVFSPQYENLINSNYSEDFSFSKTDTLIIGQDGTRKSIEPSTGLNRREMFSNATDISINLGEETLTQAEYEQHLLQRGLEDLSKNIPLVHFDGQAETSNLFVYGEDFQMGDIVQFRNEYGLESRSRITEMIYSESLSGVGIYPTFTKIEE